MTSKREKNGLELFIVSDEMLAGVETLALQFKKAGDNHTYDFLMSIKTALSKYPVAAKHANEMATLERAAAKALTEAADYKEQLFPQVDK
jgi:hypothetical protein